MREPTFVIAGGQRCGTTWLYHLLDAHPDVYMAKPVTPEPKFFVTNPAPGRGVDWYLRTWFGSAAAERAVGEKSTSYMDAPGVPHRLKDAFPRLRIVFVLRNPLDRAISNYRFSRQHGLESAPLDTALTEEARRLRETAFPGISVHPLAYIQRSRYADHIDRFLDCFERRALHMIIEDDLAAQPGTTCRQLFSFLGIDPDFQARDLAQRQNVSPTDDVTIAPSTVEYVLEQLAPSTQRLARLLGRDLDAWTRPSPMVSRMLAAHSRRAPD